MKLPSAAQMRRLDSRAIETYAIPGLILMENAGRGAVEAMVRRFGSPKDKVVPILVGPGNNGGDGLVVARHLHQLGGLVRVYLLVAPDRIKGDAAINLRIVRQLPIPIQTITGAEDLPADLRAENCWAVVDAIFGIGLQREITGRFAAIIRRLPEFAGPVVAIDIPSGLDADTGQVLGEGVRAALTVTCGLPKPGLIMPDARPYVGELEIIDIGIPPAAVDQEDIRLELLEGGQVGQWLPRRPAAAHKGTYGHLLVVAGCRGKTGAAMLCGQGALRAGSGLVTLAAPADLNQIYEINMIEAMTWPLSTTGHLSIHDYDELAKAMAGKQAMVIGPGLGIAAETAELVNRLYREAPLPMVVDADALNILTLDPAALNKAAGPRILTPHPGEMSRLLGLPTAEIQKNRLKAAEALAARGAAAGQPLIVVLKGAGTIIAGTAAGDHAGIQMAINPTGNAGMAAGGMGDVLTGVIGGFLAQGLPPWQAACLGVYSHGLAGDRLAAATNRLGFLAGELAAELPLALRDLREAASGKRQAGGGRREA